MYEGKEINMKFNWKFWQKSNIRKQLTLTLCDGMDVDDTPIPVDKGYMESNNTYEAWFIIRRWLIEMQNNFDGRPIDCNRPLLQLIDERNAIPIPLGLIFSVDSPNDIRALTDIKPIAREKYKEEKSFVEQSMNRNKFLMNTLVIVGGAMCCFVLIMAAIWLFQSGKLQLPF
jgi:hypothetical protein